MKSFSPTTAFGWLRFAVCAVLIGHVVWTMLIQGIYFIDGRYAAAITAVYLVIDKFLGGLQGHFMADSPPGPKGDE